jgi:hypothetical protein
MNHSETIPAGYWKNAAGNLVPEAKVKAIDKDRTRVVTELCQEAKAESARIFGFKSTAMERVEAFIQRSLAEYDVAHGGKKGNVTLISFDGKFKIVRQNQENIVFDERLKAAEALIQECIQSWSKGSNANIKVLVNDAFQVDQAGKISTGRVLGLRRLNIDDAKWKDAMQAISDSTNVVGAKRHIRFYERDDATGEFVNIPLDVAAV